MVKVVKVETSMALADLKLYREPKGCEINRTHNIDDVLSGILDIASSKITELWQAGIYEYIQNIPQLDQELNKIEDQLNQVWLGCRTGQNSIEDFKSIVNGWEQSYRKIIAELGDDNYVPF